MVHMTALHKMIYKSLFFLLLKFTIKEAFKIKMEGGVTRWPKTTKLNQACKIAWVKINLRYILEWRKY